MSTDNSDSDANLDYVRLSRYLAGECTAAERADVETWLAGDPARRELLASLTTAWETAGRPRRHQTSNVEGAWTKMAATLDRVETPASRVWSSPAWRIAAALLVVAGGFGVWQVSKRATGTKAIIYTTTAGDRETIGLSDSTTVILGPASRLTVAAGYGTSARDVTLEGEALFTVRHDAAKPFRVRIAGAIVEDVGTEFGVRAYTRADTVQVVVTSGVVMLRRAATPTDTAGVIRAGQIGLLAASGAALVSSVSNTAELLAWSTGQLVFDETLMSKVAVEIKRWYDVDVTVDSALAGRRISVGFNGESIDDVARVIATTIDARVERKGRVVAFRANGPPK